MCVVCTLPRRFVVQNHFVLLLGEGTQKGGLSLLFTEALPGRLSVSARMLLSLQQGPTQTQNPCQRSYSKVDGVMRPEAAAEPSSHTHMPACDTLTTHPSSSLTNDSYNGDECCFVSDAAGIEPAQSQCLQFLFQSEMEDWNRNPPCHHTFSAEGGFGTAISSGDRGTSTSAYTGAQGFRVHAISPLPPGMSLKLFRQSLSCCQC